MPVIVRCAASAGLVSTRLPEPHDVDQGGQIGIGRKWPKAAGVGSSDLVRRIDDWRRKQPTIPSRSAAARLLIERGLERERGQASRPAWAVGK